MKKNSNFETWKFILEKSKIVEQMTAFEQLNYTFKHALSYVILLWAAI